MKKPREQDTVHAILTFLALHHIPAWHMRTGATKIGGRFIRFGAVGMADIIGILPERGVRGGLSWEQPGQFLAIEVKSGKGIVTPAQQSFLDQVNAAGGKAFVARMVADVVIKLGLGVPFPTVGGQPISWATARRLSEDGP